MAETQSPQATAGAAQATKAPDVEPSVKKGDVVNIVTCRDGNVEAIVTRVGKNDKLDVEFVLGGQDVEITGAPHDPTGKQPDSWHRIPAEQGRD